MVAVTESKLYFYINETKKNIHILSQANKITKKRTRLTKTYELKQRQNIKRNHHTHTCDQNHLKITPILIFCTYNPSLERKENLIKDYKKINLNSCSRNHSPTTQTHTHTHTHK